MSRRRSSQPLLEKKIRDMEAEAARLEREIGKAGVFADGVKTDFWKMMEEKFGMELGAIDSKLDNYVALNDNEIRDCLAGRLHIRGFLGVKDFVKARAAFQNRLTMLQGRIKDGRDKLST